MDAPTEIFEGKGGNRGAGERPGQRQLGDYVLLEELGRGGMGIVWRARHVELKRHAAVKTISTGPMALPVQIERFRREAEAAARLDHPNIVSLYAYGEDEGCHFIAMRLVEGARSLAASLRAGPLTPRRSAELVATIAGAVHYSHQHGIIHRDIKPANILLDAEDEPLLTDFGLARLEDAKLQITQTNHIFGTPQYMPPEQATAGIITTAVDVYALGALLYECLTGRPPFQASTPTEVLRLLVDTEPKRPRTINRGIDEDLETICLKCLEKEPARRYGSAEALADDLGRWLGHRPVWARPVSTFGRVKKWARRRPGMAVMSATLVLTGLAAAVAVGWGLRKAKEREDEEWRALVFKARSWLDRKIPGQRFEAIKAIREAAAIRRSPELQNLTISALTVTDLRPAQMWRGNPERQEMVAISPDFRHWAWTRSNGTVTVSERGSGKEISVLPGEDMPVKRVLQFSPNRRWLAAGYGPKGGAITTLKVWDWQKQEPVLKVEGVRERAVDFDVAGTRLFAATAAGCRIWRLPEFEEEPVPLALPGPASCVRVSPDGRWLAAVYSPSGSAATPAGTRGGRLTIHDLTKPNAAPGIVESVHCVEGLSWSPDSQQLAMPCEDGKVRIWNHRSGELRSILAHERAAIHTAWSPDGQLLLSCNSDGSMKLWNTASDDRVLSTEDRPASPSFSPDGESLGLVMQGEEVGVLEVAKTPAFLSSPGHQNEIRSGAWSPDGSLFATTDWDSVRLWNSLLREVAVLPAQAGPMVFSKDSLIIASRSGDIHRWPMSREGPTVTLGPATVIPSQNIWSCAALSPDESRLALTDDQRIIVYDLREPVRPRILDGLAGANHVAWSPNGLWLAAGSRDGPSVAVWAIPDSKPVALLPVPGSATVAFSADDRWLITGNPEEFRAWMVGSWTPGNALEHRGGGTGGRMAVSPRKTVIALSDNRRHTSLVTPHDFRVVISPEGEQHEPLAFSPDGVILATADARGHFFFWNFAEFRSQAAALSLDWPFPPMDYRPPPIVERVVILPNAAEK